MNDIKINILEFSEYPGPRYRNQGKNSGEEFFEDFLRLKFEEALNNNLKLIVDLDGAAGYASSFLDEAFGRLVKLYGVESVKNTLVVISEEEKSWIDIIFNEILPQWS